jgi:GNAT superfamily N-acetyltransferase
MESMHISYRPTEEADREFAKNVHHCSYRNVVERQFGSWDEAVQNRFFTEGWKPGISQIILVDSKPIGSLLVEYHDDCLKLVEMQILPEYQSQGIGSEILRQQIALAKSERLPLRLQVLKENKAQELYLRHGLVKSGETDTHILMELVLKS